MNQWNRCSKTIACLLFLVLQNASFGLTLQQRLQTVADFIHDSWRTDLPSAPNGFLLTLPSGETKGGTSRLDLKYTYWVQNNALYASVALLDYYPDLAEAIADSYYYHYANEFAAYSDETQHFLTIGVSPSITPPPPGSYYRSSVATAVLDASGPEGEAIVIGTEYHDGTLGTIANNDPRLLFKYGVLQSHLMGDSTAAVTYFQQAIALWSHDNQGFIHPKTAQNGAYYTRDLAYALICDKAVPGVLPIALRNTIRNRLWTICWDEATGGVWTNYYPDRTIPNFAKQSNEISCLTLLAYEKDIW